MLAFTLLVLTAPLWAQTGLPSPRESYDRALVLFGQGHLFTADELQSLDTLRGKLADAGDTDLAGDVAVLRLAALAAANSAAALDTNQSQLAADRQAIIDAAARTRDQGGWRLTRDIGLVSFSVSTAATLLLAFTSAQDETLLKTFSGSNLSSKQSISDGLGWATIGSAGVMLLSLFPLLIGQANL